MRIYRRSIILALISVAVLVYFVAGRDRWRSGAGNLTASPVIKSRSPTEVTGPSPRRPTAQDLEEGSSRSRRLFFQAIGTVESEKAIKLLQEALRYDPTFESALERLARIYQELNRWELAKDSASNCLNVNSRNPTCHHIYVNALIGMSDDSRAKTAIEDCLIAVPQDFECLKQANLIFRSDRNEAGFDDFVTSAYASVRDPIDRLVKMSVFNWQIGKKQTALEQANQACSLGSDFACNAAKEYQVATASAAP